MYNENFFRNLDNYKLVWTVLKNGKAVQTGEVEQLNVQPQQRCEIALPIKTDSLCPHAELLLNVDFVLKTAEPLLDAGTRVAYNQFEMQQGACFRKMPKAPAVDKDTRLNLRNKSGESQVVVSNNHFTVAFNRVSGLLATYNVDGKSILGQGGTLKPNFWRAVTDNDMGAGVQKSNRIWREPKLQLVAFNAALDKKNNKADVHVEYDMPEVGAQLTLTYSVMGDGSMRVTQQIDALDIMGVNSASYLILPKILGLVTIMPFLVIFSSAMGILGAYATAYIGHILTPDDLTLGIQHAFKPWFMWMSIVKSLFFAYIIASVSSYFGYTVEGGSVEVGKASTDAVVSSSVLILFSDVFLTQMLS